MKTHTKRFLLLAFWGLLMVTLLTGCGKASKSGDEIIADIKDAVPFISYEELEITKYEILKRQTSQEDKTDIIYITLDVENEKIRGQLSYKLTYILYNDGWELETTEIYADGKHGFVPLTPPDPPEDYFPPECNPIYLDSKMESDEYGSSAELTYQITDSFYCAEQTALVTLYYNFDEADGSWYLADTIRTDENTEWLLDGTQWVNADGPIFSVKIDHYDGNNLSGHIQIVGPSGYVFMDTTGVFEVTAGDTVAVHTEDSSQFVIKIDFDGVFCGSGSWFPYGVSASRRMMHGTLDLE